MELEPIADIPGSGAGLWLVDVSARATSGTRRPRAGQRGLSPPGSRHAGELRRGRIRAVSATLLDRRPTGSAGRVAGRFAVPHRDARLHASWRKVTQRISPLVSFRPVDRVRRPSLRDVSVERPARRAVYDGTLG